MGDGNMRLFTALAHRGVEVVEVRHEGAAVAMAEGYSWAAERPGICSVTHGPGLTQVATSLVVAARNRSKLVLLVAETPDGYAGAQDYDQESFVTSCEAPYRPMTEEEDPAAVLDEVMALAEERSGPVVLAIAAHLLTAPAVRSVAGPRPGPRTSAPRSPGSDSQAATLLSAALAEAERPVLVAGRGAMAGASARLMMTIASRLGAALATTLPAKGVFDAHPFNLGVCGGLSHPAAERVLRDADLVVAIGASMGRSTTQSTRLFPVARILRLSRDPAAQPVPSGLVPVLGDAEGTLTSLVRDIAGLTAASPPWFEPVADPAQCWQEDLADYSPPIPPGTVDPRRVLAEVSQAIADDAIVVVSNGHCSGFVTAFIDAPAAGKFFAAQGFGSIGQAFTTAVGVALGAPGRKVVVFEGDAAFMMHAQEVDTAARAGADVTLFILNDQALGTEYQRLRAHDGERDAALAIVPPPDLAALARALGARGFTLDGADAGAVAEAALRPGLSVVDIRTARTVLSRHMRLPAARREPAANS
jgi:thiamine pyrophosphate-dependent acetolactate synthase large subunit-like protein